MLVDLLEALDAWTPPTDPPVASRDDVLRVHAETLVTQVEAAGAGEPKSDARQFGIDTADVPVFDDMDAATRGLVGGTLHGARLIADRAATRVVQLGGGLHHARRELASGFCVYNDLSVAIHALRDAGLRVAYLDIDVHHGDGVQWIHYDDPEVLTLSLHESGRYLFPGTGSVSELGDNPGHGLSLNVPLEPYTENESYLECFDRVVPYAMTQFAPDVIVAQCGADAHFSDPLADLMLTTQAYEQLFRSIMDLAADHSDGRLLLTLGGGYRFDATVRTWAMLYLMATGRNLPETLPIDWREKWEARRGESVSPTLHDESRSFDVPRRDTIVEQNRRVSKRLMEMVAPIWY
jgi:acetoin utilization protein AcuC